MAERLYLTKSTLKYKIHDLYSLPFAKTAPALTVAKILLLILVEFLERNICQNK